MCKRGPTPPFQEAEAELSRQRDRNTQLSDELAAARALAEQLRSTIADLRDQLQRAQQAAPVASPQGGDDEDALLETANQRALEAAAEIARLKRELAESRARLRAAEAASASGEPDWRRTLTVQARSFYHRKLLIFSTVIHSLWNFADVGCVAKEDPHPPRSYGSSSLRRPGGAQGPLLHCTGAARPSEASLRLSRTA